MATELCYTCDCVTVGVYLSVANKNLELYRCSVCGSVRYDNCDDEVTFNQADEIARIDYELSKF
jgi:hypothetical protein